jgi:hypothetical protein
MPDPVTTVTARAGGAVGVPFGGAHAAAEILLQPGRPIFYKVPEVMAMLALGRSALFDELRTRRLQSVRRGRSRLISAAAIVDYVGLLEREEAEAAL